MPGRGEFSLNRNSTLSLREVYVGDSTPFIITSFKYFPALLTDKPT